MNVIVPLAGPDFISDNHQIKSLIPFRDSFLLPYILKSRPWFDHVKQYFFVLQDLPITRNFAFDYLKKQYPGCNIIFLSDYTSGAMFSVLSATGMLKTFNEPLIVDLADIYFETSIDIENVFKSDANCRGIAFAFHSSNPSYSYFRVNKNFKLLEAKEKQVISNYASTGTYIFRNMCSYLEAASFSLQNITETAYNDLFYVSPMLNGLINNQSTVAIQMAVNIEDVKFTDFS